MESQAPDVWQLQEEGFGFVLLFVWVFLKNMSLILRAAMKSLKI